MIIPLFAIDFRKRLRTPNLKGNIIASIIILASISFLLFLNKWHLLQFKEFLYQIPIEQFSLLIVCVFAVSDMLLKILFMHPPLYKPDFIRARPISENVWCKYELLHDILNGWCLYQFVLFIPFCFTYFNALYATLVILLSYLVSVFNRLTIKLFARSSAIWKTITAVSYIVVLFIELIAAFAYVFLYAKYNEMLLIGCLLSYLSFCTLALYLYRQTNDYADSSITVCRERQSIGFSFLKMEFVTLWRSKRMRSCLFLLLLMEAEMCIFFAIGGINHTSLFSHIVTIFYAINLLAMAFQVNFFLGVEANYFCGLLSKPISFVELLERKFTFCSVLTLTGGLVLIPSMALGTISLLEAFALILYSVGFINLAYFTTMFSTGRLEINKSAFMNFDGYNSMYTIISLIIYIVAAGLIFLFLILFDENFAYLLLLSIGIAGILLRKQYFRLLQKIFKTQRYKMMERFRN